MTSRSLPPGSAAPGPGSSSSLAAPSEPGGRLWSRNFTLFFGARGVAKVGDGMLPIALAAGLLDHGMGAGAIGVAMASFMTCFAGFVVFGGVFCDRFDTLRLMIGADLVRVVTQAVAAGLFFTGHVVLWQICVIGAINGLAAGLFQPGVAGTVPRVARDVQAANGAVRTAEALAMLAGPALAGALIAVVSPGGLFAVHSATYAVGALLLALLRLPPDPARAAVGVVEPDGARGVRSRGYWADLAEGWREFRSRTWMWSVIMLWMVLMITVTGPLIPLTSTALIPEHGAGAFGLVNATLGGGTALGGIIAMRARPRHPLRAGAIGLLAFGMFPGAVGLGLPVPAIAACTVASGAAMGFWGVMWMTSIQTQVPRPVLNRIHAFEVAGSLAMMPVGQVLAGPAAALLGTEVVLRVSGVMAVVVAVALLLVPAVRGLRRVTPHPAAEPAGHHRAGRGSLGDHPPVAVPGADLRVAPEDGAPSRPAG